MRKKGGDKKKHPKILLLIFISVLIFVLVYTLLAFISYNPQRKTVFGVTFSQTFAEYLRLNWQEAYLAMLDDLKVKYLRLPTYWESIEPQKDQYDFVDIDWQIKEAAKRQVKIILVLGRRQPRWPECHDPGWVKDLSAEDSQKQLYKTMAKVVERYKDVPAIEIWQVENEPFLDFFGRCPKISYKLLEEEVAYVRSLDTRPVLITDSGELSTWFPAIKDGDYFGSTLYRITYNKYIGYFRYFFIPPSYYRVKAFLWGKSLEKTFIAELQTEPWFPDGPLDSPLAKHLETMNPKLFNEHAEFARQTNLGRVYFWGVEWWYWLKTTQKYDLIWEEAKKYF